MSLNAQEFIRYNRHIMVEQIGEKGQQTFKNAKVLIVGLGGLGCPAAQYLVASGIGQITLVDHDTIELSNLQRQILYTTDDIGKSKVVVAKQKLLALNPESSIEAIAQSIYELDLHLILDDIDIVLDCTDSAKTRAFINQACVESDVKLVSASAIQGAGQLVSFDFSMPNSPCYQCMFPTQTDTSLNCATSGVLSPLLGVMGSLQATETLRLLLNKNENLNKLTLFDAWGMEYRQFKVTKDSNCTCCNWDN